MVISLPHGRLYRGEEKTAASSTGLSRVAVCPCTVVFRVCTELWIMEANITNAIAPTHTSTRCNFNMKYLLLEASLCAQQEQMDCTSVCVYAATLLGSRSRDKPRQKILYAGAELNRLYPRCLISMSNHAV
jgi:hypothetical protein